jgi:microsomal dipeptidase-like Zn-dependent dipeptidase
VASGRLAVFLGVESGFDHEGDPDVLRALYRLGLRVVQFSTQTCFNAFADAEIDGPPVWNGINDRGRELVALMNSLGILIDITHATAQAQEQIIAASSAPVVASHTSLAAVSGTGMADDTPAHAAHVIDTVGPDHVGIGLDLAGRRSSVLPDASGYPDLLAALGRITTQGHAAKIAGENWLRVLTLATAP